MVKFKFMGTEISITDERDSYNKIRLQYESIAERCREEFINEYKENNRNLDDVINKGYDQGIYVISKVIRNTVDKLVENKFYTINNELFVEEYCQDVIELWDDAYSKINDQYMNVVLDEKQKEEYRQYRKNSRGRWQGGGFGWQNALKGSMQAGAMNAATGAVHGTFNMIGRIGSSIKVNKQKTRIFNDSSTLETLAYGIYIAVYNMHYSYTKFLEDNANLQFGYIYAEEAKKAKVVLSNIKGKNISNKEKIEIVSELINLNPYIESVYTYAISNFGDENNEISKIANYFGYDIDYYKRNIIERKFSTLQTDTENETLESKEIILQEIKRLGLNSNITEIKELDKKLNQFDEEARTVDSILFKTREEAKLAKEEKVKIESILNKANMDVESDVVNAKNKIIGLKLNTKIVNSYMESIDKKLEEIDLKARTVDNIVFNTRDESKKAREDKLKIEEIANGMDKTDEKSLSTAKEKIINIGTRLDSENKVIREIEDILSNIDIKERTVGNTLFETREEANLARTEKLKLDKIMDNIAIDNESSIKQTKIQIESNKFNTTIAQNTIEELDKRLELIDIKERTVEDLLFETREEANLAREEKSILDEITNEIDVENEKSLIKAKKQIESNSFNTEIVNIYIDRINQHMKDIYSETIDEADEHEENKDSFKSMLIGSAIMIPLGLYFFGRVGTLLKIIIGIFLLGAVVSVFEEYKKLSKSKKAIKQVKKLQKSGRI
ncbi:hypothetical protein [Romboutsia sp.]|uniref:hypothetical protein n=1 Tax=Romboutsia sp. TaxID=1965302 RepID=UPI003F35FD2A